MKYRKIIPDPILMVIAIFCITAFQVYWLIQNYARESKTLAIKTEAKFRETIMQLQVANLKLDGLQWDSKDSANGKMKIFMTDDVHEDKLPHLPKEEIVTTINVIRNKLTDSSKTGNPVNQDVVISMNKTSLSLGKDSVRIRRTVTGSSGKDAHIFKLLYRVDSLQDALRLSQVDSAYVTILKKEKLHIPFSIVKRDSVDAFKQPASNEVRVGIVHPVVYTLQLGNTFPYLMRQIMQPIIFSVLLLGITILAFVVLYKNLLRQRRLAEEKNEFISNITHELKTPIATVGVAIEALKNFNAIDDPRRTKEYLDISQNELQRLGLLVDKVLKLSMFENKEVELKYENVDLLAVVEEVISSLKLQLEKYGASVTVTHEGTLAITGDRMHLLSVIFNLADNALKYCKHKPEIAVDLKEQDSDVVLVISDNGIGIAEEYNDKVFDKFFRIPHGDTHNAKGYGLGLSYVAQVIQKHGGTIILESRPGIGTKFTITLPKSPITKVV